MMHGLDAVPHRSPGFAEHLHGNPRRIAAPSGQMGPPDTLRGVHRRRRRQARCLACGLGHRDRPFALEFDLLEQRLHAQSPALPRFGRQAHDLRRGAQWIRAALEPLVDQRRQRRIAQVARRAHRPDETLHRQVAQTIHLDQVALEHVDVATGRRSIASDDDRHAAFIRRLDDRGHHRTAIIHVDPDHPRQASRIAGRARLGKALDIRLFIGRKIA
ncbi:MAG: hypothetical protein ACKPEA_16305, partial [Planctomycetota bacterium]